MANDNLTPPSVDQDRINFLKVGAESYLPALTAVVDFQREIQATCRKALERRLKDYGEALNLNLADWPVKAWKTDTDNDRFKGTLALLGVVHADLTLSFGAQSYKPCWSTFCLCWESPWFGASFVMTLNRTKESEELFKVCKSQSVSGSFILEKSGYEIWLSMALSSDDMTVLDEKLDELISEWIRLWRGVRDLLARR